VVDIQSETAEIRQRIKKERKKLHGKNIMAYPIPYSGHNEAELVLGNERLSIVEQERDLGVIIDKSLKSSMQCATAVAATNVVIEDSYVKMDLIRQLYKSLIRPRSESFSHASQETVDLILSLPSN